MFLVFYLDFRFFFHSTKTKYKIKKNEIHITLKRMKYWVFNFNQIRKFENQKILTISPKDSVFS